MRESFMGVQVAADGVTHHVAGVVTLPGGEQEVTVWQGHGSLDTEKVITEHWPEAIRAVAIDPWFGLGLAERISKALPTRILRVIAHGAPVGTEAGAVALAQCLAADLGGLECSDGSPGVVPQFVSGWS